MDTTILHSNSVYSTWPPHLKVANSAANFKNFLAHSARQLKRFFVLLICIHGWVVQAADQRLWGYVAWWMPMDVKTNALTDYERLIFFQIEVGQDGGLDERHGWPEQWGDLTQAARDNGAKLDVSVTLMDVKRFNHIFESSALSLRLLTETLALAAQPGVSGIHLDVEVNVSEGVKPEAVQGFRSFVQSLSRLLKQQTVPRELTVFLPFGDLGAIYDAPTMAAVSFAVLQGYDAHFLDSNQAGPVSPLKGSDYLTWEKMLYTADKLGLARQKMVMSFPLYGYEWSVPSCLPRGNSDGKGRATTLLPMDPRVLPALNINIRDRVQQHGARVEPQSGSLYYTFVSSTGVCSVGWFEDSFTLRFKSEWIEQQNLRGIAFFPLGYDQGALVQLQKQRWKR